MKVIQLDPNNLKSELEYYIGQHVGTACVVPHEEHPYLTDEACKNWGGDCGVLQEVFEEEGYVWVVSDYGMGWVVTTDNPRLYIYESGDE